MIHLKQQRKNEDKGQCSLLKKEEKGQGSLFTAGSTGSHGRNKIRRMTVIWCKKKTRRAQHKQKEKSDRKSGRKKLKKEGMADNLRKQKKLDNAQQVYEEAVAVLQKVMMCGP